MVKMEERKVGATRDTQTVIEELGLSGSVSLGKCCKQTLKNWLKDLNDILIHEKYEWRVVGSMEDGHGHISCIPKDRYEAIQNLL